MSTAKLGQMIDRLYRLRTKRLETQKKVDLMKREETELSLDIFHVLSDGKLASAQGRAATFTPTTTTVPTLANWDKFYEYATTKGNDDLLKRQVATMAWRQRLESGVLVPGTKRFIRSGYSITKRGSK